MTSGKLRKNDIDRWEICKPDGSRHELTSGDGVEILWDHEWVRTRIEYAHADGYYAVDIRGSLRDGLSARLPERCA